MGLFVGCALAHGLAAAATDASAVPSAQSWSFTVLLDGREIGQHHFVLTQDPQDPQIWQIDSQADYTVRFLGLVVYRYHHHAAEHWERGCLRRLSAKTDDDGRLTQVELTTETTSGLAQIEIIRSESRETQTQDGCVLSFAYWSPLLRQQHQLLNPQTGALEPVTITPLLEDHVMVQGQSRPARAWRLKTPQGPIDVWYDRANHWVGLDATLKQTRHLSYRVP